MFKISKTSPKFLHKLETAIRSGLDHAGIASPRIISEPVRTTRLHRVCVLSDGFKNLRPSERQDLIWRITADALTKEEQMRISMILTLTPSEFEGAD